MSAFLQLPEGHRT